VADDEIGLPGRRKRAASRSFLAIGAAEADTHHAHLHLVGRADRGLGPAAVQAATVAVRTRASYGRLVEDAADGRQRSLA
jgi:hypothetical protein